MSAARLQWVDVARGIGIILVVYAHVLRGHFPMLSGPEWVAEHDRLIYSFHMPLFFVLAGLFLWPSIGRDRSRFLTSRWWQVIWPYLLWSAITAGLELAMASQVNSPISLRQVAMIPLEPIEQYWFLYALLVHQLVVAAIWPRKWLLLPAVLAGLGLLALLGGGWIQLRAFIFFPYVAAGIGLAGALQALAGRGPGAQLAASLAGWALFGGVLAAVPADQAVVVRALTLGLAGSIGVIGLAMALAGTRLGHGLAQLGQASLAIFVAHTIVSAGTRIVLAQAGIAADRMESVTAAVLLGVIVPWLIWRWASGKGITRPLGFGGGAPGAARAAA